MNKSTNQNPELAREWASALADGEARGDEVAWALKTLASGEESRARWHDYHLVGDVLRSGARAPLGRHDEAFIGRLRGRLQEETVRPPLVNARREAPVSSLVSANDAVWRWKLVAGVCSLGVALALGWQLVVGPQGEGTGARLAQQGEAPVSTLAVAKDESAVMIRDPRLDQWIAAHRQLGGTTALQSPAGFLRNATFERGSR